VALRHGAVAGRADAQAALDGRAGEEGVAPAGEVGVVVQGEEGVGAVAAGEAEDPGEDGHVGDGVLVAAHEGAVGEVLVEQVELALGLGGEAVDGVLDVDGRVDVEVPEASAQEWRAAASSAVDGVKAV
jgi:hypothetical protein